MLALPAGTAEARVTVAECEADYNAMVAEIERNRERSLAELNQQLRLTSDEDAAADLGRQIEQGVGGPAVPALNGMLIAALPRWQQGQIGDSAQVQQGPPAAFGWIEGRIGQGNQGRPLAAPRQISAAEVAHHCALQPLGQQAGIQQLPAGAALAGVGRLMPKGLSVAAHQAGLVLGVGRGGAGRLGFAHRLAQLKPLRCR